jgi:hypothetical protein
LDFKISRKKGSARAVGRIILLFAVEGWLMIWLRSLGKAVFLAIAFGVAIDLSTGFIVVYPVYLFAIVSFGYQFAADRKLNLKPRSVKEGTIGVAIITGTLFFSNIVEGIFFFGASFTTKVMASSLDEYTEVMDQLYPYTLHWAFLGPSIWWLIWLFSFFACYYKLSAK